MALPELTAVLDRYLALARLARGRFYDSLAGKLLLRRGFDADGIAVLLSASIAGAVSLAIDADAEALRAGLRQGFCDFVVAHADEALRILKNELRRGLPVSVGLVADPASCIAALIERGLQPDLLSAPAAFAPQAVEMFVERGAVLLAAHDPADADRTLLTWSVPATRLLPEVARLAAEALDPASVDTPARIRWLERSPRYLGRAFAAQQCLRMSSSEIAAFLPRVRERVPGIVLTQSGQPV